MQNFREKMTSIFPKNKQEKKEVFLALNIASDKIQAGVWTLASGQIENLGNAQRELKDEEFFNQAAAEAIDEAEEKTGLQATKIIFGLPDIWIASGDPSNNPYLSKVKKLAQDLDLVPQAFVSTTQAIIHFLKKEEGTPVNAIILRIGREEIYLALIKVGRIEGTKVLAAEESLGPAVASSLSSFSTLDVLPSRILIYGPDNLEKEKSSLISYPWAEKLPFLHFPSVNILPEDLPLNSVIYAAASDLGKKLGIQVVVPREPIASSPDETGVDEFGFVKGADIKQVNPVVIQKNEIETSIKQDKQRLNFKLPSLKIALPRIPRLFLPFSGIGVIVIGIIALLGTTGFVLFWYLPSAEVKIFVEPKYLEKELEFMADPTIETIDEANKIIPATVVKSEATDSIKVSTTGKSTVGDKAKGEVTIYNKTSAPKTFSGGTIMTTSSNLKFSLDQATSVASASAQLEGTVYGKTKASVTASEIGAKYNLPAGNDFTVSGVGNTFYNVHNDQAFNGGSSREVVTVSEDDQKKAVSELTDKMRQKIKSDLTAKNQGDQKVLEKGIEIIVTKKVFDKKTGEESSFLNLTMAVEGRATTFSDNQLQSILLKSISDLAPSGYDLKTEGEQTTLDVTRMEKGGKLVLSAHIKATLLPKINLNQIRNSILGKKPQSTEEYLKNIPNTLGFEVHLKPQLPSFLQSMPRRSEKIRIEAVTR